MPSLRPLSRDPRRPEKGLVCKYENWSVQRVMPAVLVRSNSLTEVYHSHIQEICVGSGVASHQKRWMDSDIWADLLLLHKASCLRCYCLTQFWDEVGLLFSASQWEKDSRLPGPPSACAVQDVGNLGSLHLISGRQSISWWAPVSGCTSCISHQSVLPFCSELSRGWTALDMNYYCPEQGRFNQT